MTKVLCFIGACLFSGGMLAAKGTLDTSFGPNQDGLKLLNNATSVSTATQYNESIFLVSSVEEDIQIHSLGLNGIVNSNYANNGILYINNDSNLGPGTVRRSKISVDDMGNFFVAHADLRQVDGQYEAGIRVCQYQPSGFLAPDFGNSGCYSWFWPYRNDAMSQGFPQVFAIKRFNNQLIVTGYINWNQVPQQRFELSIDLNTPFDQQALQRFDTVGYRTTNSFIRSESSVFDSNLTNEALINDEVFSQEVRLTNYTEGLINSAFGDEGSILIDDANIRINDISYQVLAGIKPESIDIKFSENAIFTSYVSLDQSNEYSRSLIIKKFHLDGALDDSFNSNGIVEIALPDKDAIEVTSPDEISDASTTKIAILESGELIVFSKLFYSNTQTLVADNKTQAFVINSTGNIADSSSIETQDLLNTFSSVELITQLDDGRVSAFGWQDTDQDNQSDSATFAVFNWDNEVNSTNSSAGSMNLATIFLFSILFLHRNNKKKQ